MENVTNKNISRAFSKAARWQIIITVLISGVALLVAGVPAGLSSLAGGVSVIVGAYVAKLVAMKPDSGTPGAALMTLLKAEITKVLIIALLLYLLFKNYQGLVPLALVGGLAGSALASGAGLRTMNENEE